MKKILVMLLFCIVLGIFTTNVNATDAIIESQKDNLNISSFINESKKYTQEAFPDIDIGQLLTSAIKGEVDNSTIFNNILNIFGKEIRSTITMLASILVIVVIHSIFKSISENLGNQSISQITYYVQYVLIVTLIMTNFAEIIDMTKTAIDNLVGFMYTLTPILITLVMTTGSIVSANVMQPIILFFISFIGNMISTIILPIVLVATVLGIISQISNKIQIDKISKFFKSSIVWVLGLVLTIFVGTLSLEGTLSSSVDGLTAKATKAAVANFIPVVGKVLGDSIDTVLRLCINTKKCNGSNRCSYYYRDMCNASNKAVGTYYNISLSSSNMPAYCR